MLGTPRLRGSGATEAVVGGSGAGRGIDGSTDGGNRPEGGTDRPSDGRMPLR